MLDDSLRELGFREVALPTDPDVQALERARNEALHFQAGLFMNSRMYDRRAPRPAIVPCEFCQHPFPANALRWKLVRWVGIPLGGLACSSCYPLDLKQLERVYAAAMKARKAA